MSLYTRNRKPYLGDQRVRDIGVTKGLSSLLTSSPLSSHFISPIKAPDAKRIYQYFVATQTKRYGKTVDLPEAATKRHIALALKEHAPVEVIRAVKYTSWISEHAFSIPFAMKALADYETKVGTNRCRTDQTPHTFAQGSLLLWAE